MKPHITLTTPVTIILFCNRYVLQFVHTISPQFIRSSKIHRPQQKNWEKQLIRQIQVLFRCTAANEKFIHTQPYKDKTVRTGYCETLKDHCTIKVPITLKDTNFIILPHRNEKTKHIPCPCNWNII